MKFIHTTSGRIVAWACLYFTLVEVAQAHERWFLNLADSSLHDAVKPELFSSWSHFSVVLGALGVVGILCAAGVHVLLKKRNLLKGLSEKLEPWHLTVLRVATGISLLVMAYQGHFLVPDFIAPGKLFIIAEYLIGAFLVLNLFPRTTGLMGIWFYVFGFLFFEPADVIQYIAFAGIFAYVGNPHWHGNFRWMRVSFGLSLVFAALMNKLLAPQFALKFLERYPVNFMQNFPGFPMDNAHFVLTAGVVEVMVGICVIFGILPRFFGAFLIALFTVTLWYLGMPELVGHLPLYGISFALLAVGSQSESAS